MIYLSKPIGGAPRYVAQHFHARRSPQWWVSHSGKVADLRPVEPHQVPHKVRRQIIKARHRTNKAIGAARE
jgi:hypothetical protein